MGQHAILLRLFKKPYLIYHQNIYNRLETIYLFARIRPATLSKKRLWQRCFPVNFAKFLRTLFVTERLWWLLPHIISNVIKQFRNYGFKLRSYLRCFTHRQTCTNKSFKPNGPIIILPVWYYSYLRCTDSLLDYCCSL